MPDKLNKLLDDTGWRILVELQKDARQSYAELGRRVGLSTPAVLERVRKLEEAGLIVGYHAELNHSKLGLPITAYIRLSVVGEALHNMIAVAENLDEVLECHRVTGTDSFVMKVAVTSVEHLQHLFEQFPPYVATTTSIILSSPVTRRVVSAPPVGKPQRRRKRRTVAARKVASVR